jgi:hypothetical protein
MQGGLGVDKDISQVQAVWCVGGVLVRVGAFDVREQDKGGGRVG